MKNLPDAQLVNRYYAVRHLPISFKNMLSVYKTYNAEEMGKPIRPGSYCSNPECKSLPFHRRSFQGIRRS